jgi:DNA-binding YbaB/EbfC family protein
MAKRGGYPGMGGMNMNNMMKQVQKMQKQMEENQKQMVESQKELEEKEFSATAGGGAVEVTVSGKKMVTKVTLDPDAVDPDDVEMLEDLIMAAVNEAMKKVDTATDEMMDKFSGGGMPGMGGIPGMGGMGGFPF